MLVEFSVKNFGPIKDTQTLSMLASSDTDLEDYYVHKVGNLRLLKLAVIYGPNASGKTTVLKALDFLRAMVLNPKIQKSEKLNFTPFLFDETSKKEASWMRIVFIQEGIKYEYEIEFNSNSVLQEKMYYYPKGRQSEFFTRTTNIDNEVSSTNWGSTIKLSSREKATLEGNALWNEPVLAAFNKSNIESIELLNVRNWFEKYLHPMIYPKTDLTNWANEVQELSYDVKSTMIDFIKKADIQVENVEIITQEKPLNISYIGFSKNKEEFDFENSSNIKLPVSESKITEKSLLFYHSIKNPDGTFSQYTLPWDYESHGTMQYYGLTAVLVALIKTRRLNSIDEIETSLHPDLMKHFILTFLANAKQSQLILTTHNLFFLEEKDILRKDAVWFTQKKEDGSTELYSLADFDSSVFRKNTSIINAYKIGKLGAKPNLGSIFIESE
jgi:AAA15 family ATPase/GTPase